MKAAPNAMKIRWLAGLIAIALAVLAIFVLDIQILFHHRLPYVAFFRDCFFILLMSAVFCLWRVFEGPTAPDRIVSIDILGILIVGFCAVSTRITRPDLLQPKLRRNFRLQLRIFGEMTGYLP